MKKSASVNGTIFKGRVIFKDGQDRVIYFLEGVHHFIDSFGTKYDKISGTIAGSYFTYPHLLVDKIGHAPDNDPKWMHRMTHEATRTLRANAQGPYIRLRATKTLWIAEDGQRFRQKDGSCLEDPMAKIKLSTLRPIYAYNGIQVNYATAVRMGITE